MRSSQERRVQEDSELEHDREKAFGSVFERYARPVYSFFARRGFTSEECRDLTQETFLRVHRGMDRFHSQPSLDSWLFTIAANIWRNEVRDRSAEKRKGQEVALDRLREGSSAVQDRADPLEDMLAEERTLLLHAALGELPPRMRRCLQLRLGQKLKYREIARVMGISTQTVKSQIYQGKRRLRTKLAEHFPEIEADDTED